MVTLGKRRLKYSLLMYINSKGDSQVSFRDPQGQEQRQWAQRETQKVNWRWKETHLKLTEHFFTVEVVEAPSLETSEHRVFQWQFE